MNEIEFENYVRGIGYQNVAMGETIELRNGVDILLEYLNDTRNLSVIKLRDIYEQIHIIERLTK